MNVTGDIYAVEKSAALTVPSQSLFTEQGVTFLFVREIDEWRRREVTIGDRSIGRTEIVEGLQSGEVVALSGTGSRR